MAEFQHLHKPPQRFSCYKQKCENIISFLTQKTLSHFIIGLYQPELYRSTAVFFKKLASASAVEVGEKFDMPDAATAVTDSVRIFIPMDELIDKDKELARLKKEQEKVQKDLDFLSKKLSNQGFLAKAPEKLVEAEKAKLAKAQEKMDKIVQSMAALQ